MSMFRRGQRAPRAGRRTGAHRVWLPPKALYSNDWVAILLLLALFFMGSQAGPERGRAPQTLESPGAPAPLVELLPRRPGRYAASLVGRSVVVDPGHGGPDAGATGHSDVPEKSITLDTAMQLARILENAGAAVHLTRSGDYLPGGSGGGLYERVQRAYKASAHIFVSLHADANPNPSVRGITTYYYRQDSAALARAIHEELLAALGAPDRGVRRGDFYVLRASPVPAVLVELGFLTNASEARLLASPDYRRRAAEAVAEGVARYFASLGPGTRLSLPPAPEPR